MYNINNIRKVVSSKTFSRFIALTIVALAVVLGLESNPDLYNKYKTHFDLFHSIVLVIFVIEIALKLFAYKLTFFKDYWNIFDFVIVAVSFIPTSSSPVVQVLRVLRLLRLITTLPQMKKIVEALLKTIPSMASIAGLMLLIFYIFSIISTQLFASAFPNWFGSLGKSFYTLFQIMTLESWSMGIVRPVMEIYPWAWLVFVPFIIIVTFIVINLVIAVIVDAMESIKQEEIKETKMIIKNRDAEILNEIHEFKERINKIEKLIKQNL